MRSRNRFSLSARSLHCWALFINRKLIASALISQKIFRNFSRKWRMELNSKQPRGLRCRRRQKILRARSWHICIYENEKKWKPKLFSKPAEIDKGLTQKRRPTKIPPKPELSSAQEAQSLGNRVCKQINKSEEIILTEVYLQLSNYHNHNCEWTEKLRSERRTHPKDDICAREWSMSRFYQLAFWQKEKYWAG